MEKHKKIGLITMALSVVLALAAIVFSRNFCGPFGNSASFWESLSICMQFVVYQVSQHSENPDDILIPVSYLMFYCLVLFAVGILCYSGALSVTMKAKKSEPKRVP